ncbi:SH3 domain-binding glutamic acid-rich-like protein 3 [Dicentrarchus labrax]|uniref:SH3 domain-binding glutamic acid-rich-like protein 3 n=1 Tax=Dicentrarchus labrax TaxID=13489 RepID=UPI0021F5295F|nr:SH3 domain-binding glutamic acid-rich-like protein 3 [Dicentrarchus labrax]
MADMLQVFYTSVSSSLEIKKHQEKIFLILDGKKIQYKPVDISQNSEDKDLMRKIAGNPTALPPQICKGNVYCGDYAAFENAVEMEQLEAFLKL